MWFRGLRILGCPERRQPGKRQPCPTNADKVRAIGVARAVFGSDSPSGRLSLRQGLTIGVAAWMWGLVASAADGPLPSTEARSTRPVEAASTPESGAASKLPASHVSWTDRLRQTWEEEARQTAGGTQFWTDIQFFHDWHIQQNVFTGHYRLLDGREQRWAWGSLDLCRSQLVRERRARQLPEMSGTGVVILHGIIRSSRATHQLADRMRQHGLLAFPMDYASTQLSIPEAAAALDHVIRHLDGVDQLHLVGHSLGGLIIRAYFDQYHDPRIRRVVMLGTPNYGAELADASWMGRNLLGPSGRQLGTNATGLIPRLPVPPVDFAVIAGGRGTAGGWNPLIPGDDDGTVTVDSVRLVGASDTSTIRALHHELLTDPEAATQTVHFLQQGSLRASGERVPVTERRQATRSDRTDDAVERATIQERSAR